MAIALLAREPTAPVVDQPHAGAVVALIVGTMHIHADQSGAVAAREDGCVRFMAPRVDAERDALRAARRRQCLAGAEHVVEPLRCAGAG